MRIEWEDEGSSDETSESDSEEEAASAVYGAGAVDPAALAAARAETARLAALHVDCRRGVLGIGEQLIAPERELGCLPGPGQCSLVLDTETTGLPWWVGAAWRRWRATWLLKAP